MSLQALRNIAAGCEGSKGTVTLSHHHMLLLPGLEGKKTSEHQLASHEVKCEDLIAALKLHDLETAESQIEQVSSTPTDPPKDPPTT